MAKSLEFAFANVDRNRCYATRRVKGIVSRTKQTKKAEPMLCYAVNSYI